MIRTGIAIIALIAAVLWLPIWLQIGLFVAVIIIVPYRILLFIPAIVADVVYAPTTTLSIGHFKMTLIVGALLLLWFVMATQTRIGNHYVSNKK